MSQLPSMKLPSLFQQQQKKEPDDDWSKMMLLHHKESSSPMVFHHDSHYYKMSTKTTTTTTDILLPPILTNPIQQTNSAFAPLSPPYSTCSSALSVSSSPSSPSSFAGNSFSSYSTATTKKGSIQSLLNSGSELLELEKHEYNKKRPLDVTVDDDMSNKMQKTSSGSQIKGLRLFSKQVYDKVAEKKITTYNQVADELAADIQRNHQQQNNIDGKNIRRRVYDALNVFMALNLISKNRKEIKWLGVDEQQQQHDALLEEEIQYEEARQQMLLHSIKTDQVKCDNAWLDLNKLNQLVQRNRQHQQRTTAVQFPFFLIQGQDMETRYHHSNEACITSSSSSIVYKDVDILAKIWPSSSTVVS
ncbi:unnamed protein product [Mucor hiemalis]